MLRKYLVELLTALSLSNLLFIAVWRRLLYPKSDAYHIKFPPAYYDFMSVILLVLFFALMLAGVLWLARDLLKWRWASTVSRWVFLLFTLFVLNAFYLVFYPEKTTSVTSKAIILLLLVPALIKWHKAIFTFTRHFLLVVSPFVFFTLSQAGGGAYHSFSGSQPEKTDPTLSQSTFTSSTPKPLIKSRIVWVLFDELDYRVPFEQQSPLINMPEFEKLRQQSLISTNATSPARNTIESVPSLIIGKVVKKAQPITKGELLLSLSGKDKPLKWSELPNIFSDVRALGGDTGVAGYYHPYCRVLGKDLTTCSWESFYTEIDFHSESLWQSIRRDLRSALVSMPLGFRLLNAFRNDFEKFEFEPYARRYENLMRETERAVTNPDIDLIFVHLPIPHGPYYYNPADRAFTGGDDYLDNLALVDRTLGTIRQSMQAANEWDDSIVIVSSDHQWRLRHNPYHEFTARELEISKDVEDPRVPFFLKLEGQQKSTLYEKPFNTVLTRALILALLKGELTNPEQVKAWLDEQAKTEKTIN